jgi:hypothetical protein
VLRGTRRGGRTRNKNYFHHGGGLSDRISSVHADLDDPAGRDVAGAACGEAGAVVLAALVGVAAPAKASISQWPGRVLSPGHPRTGALRRGLRTLLHPRVGRDDLPGLQVDLEVHPRTDVVNSVLVARAGVGVPELVTPWRAAGGPPRPLSRGATVETDLVEGRGHTADRRSPRPR